MNSKRIGESKLNIIRAMFWSRMTHRRQSEESHVGSTEIQSESQLLRHVGCSFFSDCEANVMMKEFRNALFLSQVVFEAIDGANDDSRVSMGEKIRFLEAGFLSRNLFPVGEFNVSDFMMFFEERQDFKYLLVRIRKESIALSWMLEIFDHPRSDDDWENLLGELHGSVASEGCFEGLAKKGLMFFLETCKDVKIEPHIQERIDQISAKLVN